MRIFLSTTDHSGDEHAAALMAAIRGQRPEAEFAGLGGPQMAAVGCHLLADMTQRSSLGFHVLAQIAFVLRLIRTTACFWDDWRPQVFVPIDSPGINFPLARRARARGIRNVYYIPPQLWGWGAWRLKKLRRLFDRLLVVLPFEEAYYQSRGLQVEGQAPTQDGPTAGATVQYVGHPLFDYLPRKSLVPDLKAELGLAAETPLVGLLPGSRRSEVGRLMPILCDVAEMLRARYADVRFAVGAASPALVPVIEEALARRALAAPVLLGRTLELMRDARLCLVASGTATLQLVHFATPMVVLYRLNWVEYPIMRALKRAKFLGLVNVLADRELAPERILWRDEPARVAACALPLIQDTPERAALVAGLRDLRAQVDRPGAVDRAAEAIIRLASPDA